jgi:hypothetical protein
MSSAIILKSSKKEQAEMEREAKEEEMERAELSESEKQSEKEEFEMLNGREGEGEERRADDSDVDEMLLRWEMRRGESEMQRG